MSLRPPTMVTAEENWLPPAEASTAYPGTWPWLPSCLGRGGAQPQAGRGHAAGVPSWRPEDWLALPFRETTGTTCNRESHVDTCAALQLLLPAASIQTPWTGLEARHVQAERLAQQCISQ